MTLRLNRILRFVLPTLFLLSRDFFALMNEGGGTMTDGCRLEATLRTAPHHR